MQDQRGAFSEVSLTYAIQAHFTGYPASRLAPPKNDQANYQLRYKMNECNYNSSLFLQKNLLKTI